MWHVSIARLNTSGPIPTTRWGRGTVREACRRAGLLLADVGTGVIVENMTKTAGALHFRKSLSDAEMAMLSCEWLALPARDEFGPDGLIEMAL